MVVSLDSIFATGNENDESSIREKEKAWAICKYFIEDQWDASSAGSRADREHNKISF